MDMGKDYARHSEQRSINVSMCFLPSFLPSFPSKRAIFVSGGRRAGDGGGRDEECFVLGFDLCCRVRNGDGPIIVR